MLTVKQAPYTGPLGSTETKHRSTAPSIEALKRALSRMGYMAWKDDYTQRWPAGGELDNAFREWERSLELPGNGVYMEQEWKALRAEKVPAGRPHAGEYALDKYARKLIRDDWQAENVPDETDVRAAITKFCLIAESREPYWHYRLVRPLDVSVDPAAAYIVSDCSMFCIQAYNYAGRMTGLAVPDPSKQGYTGYGNTDYYENDHPRVLAPFRVGDLSHYPGHVTICRRAGDAQSAIFTSHGKEAGPIPTQIYYRSDFLYVVRPPLT